MICLRGSRVAFPHQNTARRQIAPRLPTFLADALGGAPGASEMASKVVKIAPFKHKVEVDPEVLAHRSNASPVYVVTSAATQPRASLNPPWREVYCDIPSWASRHSSRPFAPQFADKTWKVCSYDPFAPPDALPAAPGLSLASPLASARGSGPRRRHPPDSR